MIVNTSPRDKFSQECEDSKTRRNMLNCSTSYAISCLSRLHSAQSFVGRHRIALIIVADVNAFPRCSSNPRWRWRRLSSRSSAATVHACGHFSRAAITLGPNAVGTEVLSRDCQCVSYQADDGAHTRAVLVSPQAAEPSASQV